MHNYLEVLLKHMQNYQAKPGQLVHIHVKHDDECNLLSGAGECDCKPDIEEEIDYGK